METVGDIMSKVLTAMFVLVVISAIFAFPTMWLWNAVVPDVFGLPRIGALQALWLFLLSGMFFKPMGASKN